MAKKISKRDPNVNLVEEIKYATMEKAEGVLKDALEEVSTKSKQHGDTEASFTMIAEMWSVYIKHVAVIRGWTEVDASDVAQLMTILKIVRSVYGHGMDNYVDAAGYSALAAMLSGKKG